jgi:hypothetical protein
MEPEATSAAAQAVQPAETSKLEAGNEVKDSLHNKDNLISYKDRPSFNFAIALAWLVALLSILATLYFWWLNKNVADSIADKQSIKDGVEQQLLSPAMVKAEKDALDFKTSVGILSKANKDRYSYSTFLPEFYTKITNDTKISALSVTSSGEVSISGTTKSYRAIADLAMALKSWDKLSGVEILSASMGSSDSGTGGRGGTDGAVFSISAKIVTFATDATSASSVSNTTGGQ